MPEMKGEKPGAGTEHGKGGMVAADPLGDSVQCSMGIGGGCYSPPNTSPGFLMRFAEWGSANLGSGWKEKGKK